jgi:membrane peptidoglycan carboxypeptidase
MIVFNKLREIIKKKVIQRMEGMITDEERDAVILSKIDEYIDLEDAENYDTYFRLLIKEELEKYIREYIRKFMKENYSITSIDNEYSVLNENLKRQLSKKIKKITPRLIDKLIFEFINSVTIK